MATTPLIPACLTGLIGLSQRNCNCTNENKPTDAANSASGVFVDEIEGFPELLDLDGIGECQGIWDIMTRSRNIGLRRTLDEITIMLNTNYKPQQKPFIGTIGGNNYTVPLESVNDTFVGVRMQMAHMQDSLLDMTKIMFYSDRVVSSIPFGLYKVYRDNQDVWRAVELYAEDLHLAEGVNELEIPEDKRTNLPLVDDKGLPIDYYMFFDRSESLMLPMNNKTGCNCGANERLLHTYMQIQGIQGSDGDNFKKWNSNSSYANGFSIEARIQCKSDLLICSNMQDNPEIYITVAYAAAYRSAQMVVEEILKSDELTAATMRDRKYLWGKRNHFEAEFNKRIVWLSQDNLDLSESDCYVCNDNRVFKAGIRS